MRDIKWASGNCAGNNFISAKLGESCHMREDDPLHYIQDYPIKMEAEFSYNIHPPTPHPGLNSIIRWF